MLAVTPSRRLVIHEWKKHGSCSDSRFNDYFAMDARCSRGENSGALFVATLRYRRSRPERSLPISSRPTATSRAQMIAVECGNRTIRARLSELRVCFARARCFHRLRHKRGQGLRAQTIVMPRVRLLKRVLIFQDMDHDNAGRFMDFFDEDGFIDEGGEAFGRDNRCPRSKGTISACARRRPGCVALAEDYHWLVADERGDPRMDDGARQALCRPLPRASASGGRARRLRLGSRHERRVGGQGDRDPP